MDANNSGVSSVHSSDTDILIKIPNNFFDLNYSMNNKSHFSNDNDFMKELDNFLHTERAKDVLNSTGNEDLCYKSFVEPLNQSEIDQAEDLNLQEEKVRSRSVMFQFIHNTYFCFS